ncbi:MAG TPA: response regulator transcription factor [Pseudonocardia sp.]|uniref:response regulator transcription factor n=1 Tax=Pseudonocardia sp. TaxID=60912 RepID=UPI002F3FA214
MSHVLVIEDDAAARGGLVEALSNAEHAISSAATGMAGLQVAMETRPDIVLLNLSLPDLDGMELLPMLRAALADIPVIVVTSYDDESRIIAALDAGADDYLVRPFGFGSLLARVRAVLRRREGVSARRPTLVLGGLAIDLSARTAELDGRALSLSPKEFDLLSYMARRAGQVVSKRELLAEVWRTPFSQADKTVDVHVSWLRRKLRESGKSPRYLHTVRGVGLRLDAPRS